MNQPPTPPRLVMPERIRKLAENVTLADLLDSPTTASDAISLISNIVNHGWVYAELKSPDDLSIERDLFAISQAYGIESRHLAFNHMRERRQYTKDCNRK